MIMAHDNFSRKAVVPFDVPSTTLDASVSPRHPAIQQSSTWQGNKNNSHFANNYRGEGGSFCSQDSQNAVNDASSVRRDREREGRCADCGAQTHELKFDPKTGAMRKEPLNVENEVHRGRCLLCHPLPLALILQQQQHGSGGYWGGNSFSSWNTAGTPPYAGDYVTSMVPSSRSVGTDTGGESVHSGQSHQSASVAWGHSSNPHIHSNFHGQGPNHAGHNMSHVNVGNPPLQEFIIYSSQGGTPSRLHHGPHQQQHHSSAHPCPAQETIAADRVSHNCHGNDDNNRDMAKKQPQLSTENSAANSPHQDRPHLVPLSSNIDGDADMCEILSNMRRYPNHLLTQQKGCETLWVLSWDDENAAAIGRVGGVQTVLDAMRLHPTATCLQSNACAALQNLAMNEYNRDMIAESGGIAVIVDAMRRNLREEAIQQSGCAALANLANGSVDHKISVAECGGILAVMKAVENHPGEESVLRAAYQALRMLGYNPGSQGRQIVGDDVSENGDGDINEDDDGIGADDDNNDDNMDES